MHEIIHLQFGPRSNHVGTHYWNIAESLFSYGDEDVDYGVVHDVDWRQGIGREGEETYTPRLILVDIKENFGALPNINALYNTTDTDPLEDILAPPQIIHTQQSVTPSPYQTFLSNPPVDEDSIEDPPVAPAVEKTRFWSDYNRVWYHPRSMNPLPAVFRREKDEMGLGEGMGSWGEGLEGWKAMSLLDPSPADNFRLFAEESDLLQGVQLSLDISTGFAAMACEMLGEFKDDYPKGDSISIGLLGGLLGGGGEKVGGGEEETDAARNMREISRIFTESQGIKTLIDQGSTVLPLQAPEETWLSPTTPSPASPSFDASNPCTRLSPSNLHLSSALLATHLASALLPLRLKADRISLPTLVQKLNWRGDTRIIGLSGRAPIWDINAEAPPALGAVVEGWDFSSAAGARAEKYTPFFSHSVIRGVGQSSLPALLASLEASSGGLKGHLLSTQSLPSPLPLLPPFPPIFFPPTTPSDPSPLPASNIALASTLSTTTLPRHLLSSHAKKIDSFLRRHGDMRMSGMGEAFGRDEGRELVEGLWGIGEGVAEEVGDEGEEDLGDERMD